MHASGNDSVYDLDCRIVQKNVKVSAVRNVEFLPGVFGAVLYYIHDAVEPASRCLGQLQGAQLSHSHTDDYKTDGIAFVRVLYYEIWCSCKNLRVLEFRGKDTPFWWKPAYKYDEVKWLKILAPDGGRTAEDIRKIPWIYEFPEKERGLTK